jgi:uncharacterized membrane protein YhhN
MAVWIAGSQFSAGQTILMISIIDHVGIVLTMGWMATRTRMKLAIIGVLLFLFSGSFLVIDRFVYEIPNRDTFIMMTYYAAQVFIVASIGSRVVKYSVNRNNLIR